MLGILLTVFIISAILMHKKLCSIATSPVNRSVKIEFISFAVVVGFALAVMFHYMLTYYWGATSPRNSFILYKLGGQFGDFRISLFQDYFFAPYDESLGENKAQYFPFSYVLLFPMTLLREHSAIVVYSLFFAFSMFMFVRNYFSRDLAPNVENKLANYKNIFIISFLSYPFLFSLERGNLENILFVLIALSLYFYARKQRFLCSLFLAMAAAMKLYPLFFITYFISEKKYLETMLTVVLFAALILASLLLLRPGFYLNIIGWLTALKGMGGNILYAPDTCVRYNLGLWGLIKTACLLLKVSTPIKVIGIWYHVFVAVMLPVIVSCIVFFEKIAWRKLVLIVFSVLLFPEMSNDYKLLLVLFPLASFVNAEPAKHDVLFMVLFVLLLIPKNYAWIHHDISIANVINPVIMFTFMLTLMIAAVSKYFKQRVCDKKPA